MSATDGAGTFRSRVQELLHASILDAAWARACETTWGQVRLADVAADVGVSRQTIYNEFGSKDRLAAALFEREMNTFLTGIRDISGTGDSLPKALRAAIAWTLEQTDQHPMLTRMIKDAREGEGDTLLPELTVRADAILLPMREALTDFYCQEWPEIPRNRVQLIADLFVRFVMSLIILPTDLDREAMVEVMVRMAVEIDLDTSRVVANEKDVRRARDD